MLAPLYAVRSSGPVVRPRVAALPRSYLFRSRAFAPHVLRRCANSCACTRAPDAPLRRTFSAAPVSRHRVLCYKAAARAASTTTTTMSRTLGGGAGGSLSRGRAVRSVECGYVADRARSRRPHALGTMSRRARDGSSGSTRARVPARPQLRSASRAGGGALTAAPFGCCLWR